MSGAVAMVAGCTGNGPSASASARPGATGTSFAVTVSKQPGGTVTSADGKIRCGTGGALCGPVSYAWTETAVLTATADAGNMFGTWAGDCLGRPVVDGEYVCTLDTSSTGADKFVAAVFGEQGRTQHVNFTDPALHGVEFLSWVAMKPDAFECTYCHGATYDGVGIAPSCNDCHARNGHPGWLADCTFCHGAPPPPAPSTVTDARHPTVSSDLGTCTSCHPETVDGGGNIVPGGKHMNGAVDGGHSPGFATPVNGLTPHGTAANYHERTGYPNGLADCRGCHGDDLAGGKVNVSCDRCHPGFQTSCTFCHGDASRSVPALRAAPPVDTQGRTSATGRGVGAHQTHLAGRSTGAISDGVLCEDCHRVPSGIEHVDGNVATGPALSLVRPGTQTEIGTFSAADGSCATTYCHGNFQNGKATTTAGNRPLWTQTSGQSACGTCHASQVGADATWGHRVPTHTTVGCFYCHVGGYGSIEDDPTLVNPTEHVNGSLNVSGAINGLGYSTTTHTCSRSCHGAVFNGTPLDWTKVTR